MTGVKPYYKRINQCLVFIYLGASTSLPDDAKPIATAFPFTLISTLTNIIATASIGYKLWLAPPTSYHILFLTQYTGQSDGISNRALIVFVFP
jgi:hypothetical protein